MRVIRRDRWISATGDGTLFKIETEGWTFTFEYVAIFAFHFECAPEKATDSLKIEDNITSTINLPHLTTCHCLQTDMTTVLESWL